MQDDNSGATTSSDDIGVYSDLKSFLDKAGVGNQWFQELKKQEITLNSLKAGFKGMPGLPPTVDLAFLTNAVRVPAGVALNIMNALTLEFSGELPDSED